MADLIYGSNVGCIAQQAADGGTPGQCGRAEEMAVPHRYHGPRPHDARLYVCAHHARGHPTAEPLTDEDRRVIAARRARRDEQLEPARRAGQLPPSLR